MTWKVTNEVGGTCFELIRAIRRSPFVWHTLLGAFTSLMSRPLPGPGGCSLGVLAAREARW